MLGDGFRNAIEDAFQIIKFARVLDFNDNDFPFTVKSLDIHTIELVIHRLLVAFTFQYLTYRHLFT